MIPDMNEPTFYECCDSDRLTHFEECDAVSAAIEGTLEMMDDTSGAGTDTVFEAMHPLEVTSWCQLLVSDTWIADRVSYLIEEFEIGFATDFGDPEDHEGMPFSDVTRVALVKGIVPLFVAAVDGADVWRCEVVGTKTLSESELKAYISDAAKEWNT
jgi:hypothetical protein